MGNVPSAGREDVRHGPEEALFSRYLKAVAFLVAAVDLSEDRGGIGPLDYIDRIALAVISPWRPQHDGQWLPIPGTAERRAAVSSLLPPAPSGPAGEHEPPSDCSCRCHQQSASASPESEGIE